MAMTINGTTGLTYNDSTLQSSAALMLANGVIQEHTRTISANYAMTASRSGMTVGPITLNTGVTVTLPTGCRLVIL
jgi:hypothetical protein